MIVVPYLVLNIFLVYCSNFKLRKKAKQKDRQEKLEEKTRQKDARVAQQQQRRLNVEREKLQKQVRLTQVYIYYKDYVKVLTPINGDLFSVTIYDVYS